MNSFDVRICKMIQDILEGRMGFAAFWEQSKDLPDGATPKAQGAWADASHYVSDEDIRARDPEYARRTADQLRSHLQALGYAPQRAAE
jgi:hypothetical protein